MSRIDELIKSNYREPTRIDRLIKSNYTESTSLDFSNRLDEKISTAPSSAFNDQELPWYKKAANILLPKSLEYKQDTPIVQTMKKQQEAGEQLGYYGGTRIKVPFAQKEFIRPTTPGEGTFKMAFEFPGRVKNSLIDIYNITTTGEVNRDKKIRVPTFIDDAEQMYFGLRQSGASDKEALTTAIIYGTSQGILDIGIATDLTARGILKITKFDPLVNSSLNKLGLDTSFTIEQFQKNVETSAKNLIQTGQYNRMPELLQDTLIISDALEKSGVQQANKITRFLQDISKKVVQPLGFKKPAGFPLTTTEALPGEAIVGTPQPAFGMSIQPRTRVGDLVKKQPVATDLAQEAKYVYHGTSEGAARAIQREGELKIGQAIGSYKTGYRKELFFADTEQHAQSYAVRKSNQNYLLRTKKTGEFIPDTNVISKGDLKIGKNISIKDIEIKMPNGKWTPIKNYDFYTQATKGVGKVVPPSVNKILGIKPAKFIKIRKRETTLLKERIKDIQKSAKTDANKNAEIQKLKNQFEVKLEKSIRQAELKGFRQTVKRNIQGIREGEKLSKERIINVQEQFRKLIKDSNLRAEDREKFTDRIKNIAKTRNPVAKIKEILPDIEKRIDELEQSEFKRGIVGQINKELKNIKPVKKGTMKVSRYDYETNKFLQNLKDINKYTQEQAQVELTNVKTENLNRADLIKNRLLSFKANGMKSSVALQAQVLADIQDLKVIGKEAKDELDFQKKLERQEKKDEILEGIINQKKSWAILKPLKSSYISSVGNLYSDLNVIAGKGIADKYDYGMYQTNSKQDAFVKTEEFKNKAKKIYGLEKDRQLTKVFIDDLAKKDYKIIDIEGLSEDISKFDLMNIYNGIKNDLIKERYYNFFGEEQINSLLQNLTVEDMQLSDYLMKEVQSYKEILNQRSIEIRGLDNGSVENYWPSVSEYMPEFFDDIKIQGEMTSSMKERSKSSKIIPKMANAWLLSQKHIAEAEHVKTLSRKYEELKNLFSDRTIRKTIETKYGDEAYNALMKHIETFSLNYRTEGLDIISGIYDKALNNWVRAKVASPTVFARQMISAIYSVEQVGIKNFVKYQKEFVANPSKAFKYMWDNIPFIRNRFKMGYSEALVDVIRGTKKMSVGMDSITKYTTLMTRGGDITAIMLNGYPIIKSEMAKHGNMEKAIDVFQKFSEKTQQSPTKANISDLQRNRGAWHKTFFRFKNTTNQLLRLQVDANIQFINKQIPFKDYVNKTLLYSIYTPIMYVLVGYAITQGWKTLFGTDDDEETESLLGDFIQQIIIQPFQAIPFLDMATEWTYSKSRQKITGKKYNYGMFSYPLFDDIETAGSKLFKKEPSAMDLLEALSLIQEPVTGIPTGTILRYFKYTKDKKSGGSKSNPFNTKSSSNPFNQKGSTNPFN